MWALHKGKRDTAYNLDLYDRVVLQDDMISLVRDDSFDFSLHFETPALAKQAFEHFLKSIKTGEKLINL